MDTQTSTTQTAPLNVPEPPPPPLAWSAPVHPVHERSSRWYAIAGTVLLACVVYGIFSGAWTFSLVMFLIGGMYFLLREAPSVIKSITINDQGFEFDGQFTSWGDTKDFWLVGTPNYMELHIARRKGVNREIVIQTGDIDIAELRKTVGHYVPERSDQKERLLDIIIRICKL